MSVHGADRRPRGRWMGAPVVHFVAIGGLLFAIVEARRAWEGPGPDAPPPVEQAGAPKRPVVALSDARVRQLGVDFRSQFGRLPSQAEFAAFVQHAVDAEILEAEARRLSLGFGDPSIRMRLVQKMRAVSEDPGKTEEVLHREALDLGLDDDVVVRRLLREKMRLLLARGPEGDDAVGEDDVRAYVERHRERFVRVEAVTFSHVFLSPRVHGARLRAEVEAALREVRGRPGPAGAGEDLSDPFPLGLRLTGWPRAAVARHFGDEFAAHVLAQEPGSWNGPISSSLGLHLVWVHERIPGAMPPLDAVRPGVTRAILEERAAERFARGLEALRRRYEVRIEGSAEVVNRLVTRRP